MLLQEPEILEVLTFKAEHYNDEVKLWLNVHHFEMSDMFATASVHQTMHQAVLSEMFLHVTDVSIPFVVAYPLNAANPYGYAQDCYSWCCMRGGGYSIFAGERATDFEVGFIMKKQLPFGRNGRLLFRRALKDTDINISHDERIYHAGSDEITSVRERYFTEHMSQSYYPAVSITRAANFGAVESYQLVQRFAVGHAVVMQSIADAQERKTFIALTYKRTAQESFSYLVTMQLGYEELTNYPLDEVEVERVIAFLPLAQNALGTLESIQLYWTEGIKPGIAAEWRPGKALDPFQSLGHSCCGRAVERVSFLLEELADILERYQAKVPRWELEQRLYIVWQVLTAYGQMMLIERWTGTPIPIDFNLGTD